MASPSTIYHEKQRKQLCALHSLNNVLQDKYAFSQRDLESICLRYRLSPNNRIQNPHKSLLGLGNYDINVIMAALQTKNLEAIWFDKRKNPRCLNLDKIHGFILNTKNYNKNFMSFLYYLNPVNFFSSKKHWIAVKKINDNYYNLDSKLDSPLIIGGEKELFIYLEEKNASNECEILLVVEKDVAESHSFYVDKI